MISIVLWMFYAGVSIGCGWVAGACAKEEGNGPAQCAWSFVVLAAIAPLAIGMAAAVLILRPVFRS